MLSGENRIRETGHSVAILILGPLKKKNQSFESKNKSVLNLHIGPSDKILTNLAFKVE